MLYETDPEPTAAERAALLVALAALDRLAGPQNGTPSPWWRAGLPEDAEDVGEDP